MCSYLTESDILMLNLSCKDLYNVVKNRDKISALDIGINAVKHHNKELLTMAINYGYKITTFSVINALRTCCRSDIYDDFIKWLVQSCSIRSINYIFIYAMKYGSNTFIDWIVDKYCIIQPEKALRKLIKMNDFHRIKYIYDNIGFNDRCEDTILLSLVIYNKLDCFYAYKKYISTTIKTYVELVATICNSTFKIHKNRSVLQYAIKYHNRCIITWYATYQYNKIHKYENVLLAIKYNNTYYLERLNISNITYEFCSYINELTYDDVLLIMKFNIPINYPELCQITKDINITKIAIDYGKIVNQYYYGVDTNNSNIVDKYIDIGSPYHIQYIVNKNFNLAKKCISKYIIKKCVKEYSMNAQKTIIESGNLAFMKFVYKHNNIFDSNGYGIIMSVHGTNKQKCLELLGFFKQIDIKLDDKVDFLNKNNIHTTWQLDWLFDNFDISCYIEIIDTPIEIYKPFYKDICRMYDITISSLHDKEQYILYCHESCYVFFKKGLLKYNVCLHKHMHKIVRKNNSRIIMHCMMIFGAFLTVYKMIDLI
jgi:hypothetical protein